MATNARVRLHGTPLSHFTRKIRILLAELCVPHELVRPSGVLLTERTSYGGNPLLRVPVLEHGGTCVFDSDHIARYLVKQFDSDDRLGVCSDDVAALNRLAVTNGVMSNVVVLILAQRGGLEDLTQVAYFRKLIQATREALDWLDGVVEPAAETFDYRDVALVCMWQHLEHYGLISRLDAFQHLAARVARLAARPSVLQTTPAASLQQAAADGWVAG